MDDEAREAIEMTKEELVARWEAGSIVENSAGFALDEQFTVTMTRTTIVPLGYVRTDHLSVKVH